MIRPRTGSSSLLLGVLAAGTFASATASVAQDYVRSDTIAAAANRCVDFGPDVIDMGNGICARLGNGTRLQMGIRNAGSNGWTTGGTSSAALRSDSIMPDAAVQHLRVRGGLEASPY